LKTLSVTSPEGFIEIGRKRGGEKVRAGVKEINASFSVIVTCPGSEKGVQLTEARKKFREKKEKHLLK